MNEELKNIWLFFTKIVSDIEDWEKQPIKGYIELKMIEKALNKALNKIKDYAYDDLDNYDKDNLPYWYKGSITNKLNIEYKEDQNYLELFEKLKEREKILKEIVEQNKKGQSNNDEIKCPSYSYTSFLVIKK